MSRFVINDDMWAKLEALLPEPKGRHGKNNRLFLEAACWVLSLFNQIGPGNLFYPIFLLPKKIINLERDLNREYSVGSDRVAEFWEDFEKWKPICPEIFFDNSKISVNELSKNIIEAKGFCHSEIETILSVYET